MKEIFYIFVFKLKYVLNQHATERVLVDYKNGAIRMLLFYFLIYFKKVLNNAYLFSFEMRKQFKNLKMLFLFLKFTFLILRYYY